MIIIISAFVLASCNTEDLDFDNVKVQPVNGVFGFPLGETKYLMSDLLGKQTGDSLDFKEDSTSFYTLMYFDTIKYQSPDDFIKIGDIVHQDTVKTNAAPSGATIPVNASFNIKYNPKNNEPLDSIFYKSGDLSITTNSDLPGTLNYSYTIENTRSVATNNSVVLNGSVVGSGSDTQTKSLANHKTLLSGGSNTLKVNLNASITLTGAITTANSVSFKLTYANQEFSLIYGRFGQDTVKVGDQSIEIDFFSQSSREGITFGNPSLEFDFRNSFGIPVEADFSGINGDDGNGGNQTFLAGRVVNQRPIINGSDIESPKPEVPGDTEQTVVKIDRTNSNLIKVLASSPKRLVFDVTGRSNAKNASELNYLQPTSELTAYVKMEIPMEIQMTNFKESGTFSLGDGLELDNVDSAFIRVLTLNELPFSGTASLEIQDADSTTLYTVADSLVLKAPFINVQGIVTDPSGNTADIPLTPEGVEALKEASHVLITLTLNTPESQTSRDIYVKVLGNYSLTMKVGVGGKLNVDF